MPEAATKHTKAGAEAFVRYYWEVVNYAQATGDTDQLRELSAAECQFCSAGADGIEAVYTNGGRIEGGEGTPQDLETRILTSEQGRIALVDVALEIGAMSVLNQSSSAPTKTAQSAVRDEFQLFETSVGWTTVRITSKS